MAGYSVTYSVVDNATKQIDAINRRVAQMRAPMERMQRSVTRFVDVSGLRKVATGFEWIYKAAGSVLRTLTSIVPVMGAITGAASIAGMVKLVQSYANWSHELVAAADNIGITTQQLQKFQDATRLAGGNADDMTSGLKSLHDRISDLAIGKGNVGEAAQMLNRLGVNIRDANGHIRTADDLMPELIKKIGAMTDPADRARFATELLGAQGDKLVETFRQSSKGFDDWTKDVERYKTLTDEQKRSLQLFTEAQGKLGVQFDRMGQQISAMLARDFGPLLQRFSDFVEKNTPAILAAVDDLSKRFAAWLQDPETGKAFTAAIKSVADSLTWVINNLDTIKTGVEVVAGLFALKWAGGIVQAIGTVTQAFGVVGAGGAAGLGLLGALGLVIWLTVEIIRHWSELKQAGVDLADAVGKSFERVQKTMSDWWSGKRDPNDMPKPGETPSYPTQRGTPGGAWAPSSNNDFTPGGAWARPPGAIQKQSASGGYLPGGVTRASFGGGAAGGVVGGVAAIGPSEFWIEMAAAVAKGFEDAFDHITGFAGGGGGGAGGAGGGGGFQQAAFHPGAGGGFGPSPNVQPASIGSPIAPPPSRAPGAPVAPLGAAAGKGAFYDEQRKLIYDAAVKAGLPHPEVVAEVGATQAQLESGGGTRTPGGFNVYGIKSGGGVGGAGAPVSTQEEGAGGRYTTQASFATFGSKEEAAAGYVDFLKKNPRHYTALMNAGTVEEGLQAQGRSGYATASNYLPTLQQIHKQYGGKAATVPPPQAPNGSVDVNITHKNPPPNSAVTASGSGAVNVAPVRVEHQNMSDI